MNLFSLEQTLTLDGQVRSAPSLEFSNALDRLSLGYILLEHDYLGPFAWDALTPFEQSIATGFSERRKRSFIASRISLKLLAYKMGLVHAEQEAHTLETANRNDRRPILSDRVDFYASVSHDKRFVLTVADKRPIGVDIEVISPKLVKAGHIFMSKDELATAGSSGLDMTQGATMIWTAKEAASKALNLHLIDAWRAVHLAKLDVKESIFIYGGGELTATHLFAWDRVISLVSSTAL